MNNKVINPTRPFEPLEPHQDVTPAADAGPRQPLPNLLEVLRAAEKQHHDGGGCTETGCGCPGSQLSELNERLREEFEGVPPVPQEAAPRLTMHPDRTTFSTTMTADGEPAATATDWAMRVAHSDGIAGGKCPGCEDCNPTIREKLAKAIWDADTAEDIRKYPSLTKNKSRP